MTFNIPFFTITIKKQKVSREKAEHQEFVKKIYEKLKDKQNTHN